MLGSVAPNRVPPVTLPPAIILSLTGFQMAAPAGASNAVPNLQVAGLKGPVLVAPAGAASRARLSVPAGAASGNVEVPGAALVA